jgi:hypothetical protein
MVSESSRHHLRLSALQQHPSRLSIGGQYGGHSPPCTVYRDTEPPKGGRSNERAASRYESQASMYRSDLGLHLPSCTYRPTIWYKTAIRWVAVAKQPRRPFLLLRSSLWSSLVDFPSIELRFSLVVARVSHTVLNSLNRYNKAPPKNSRVTKRSPLCLGASTLYQCLVHQS